VSEELFSGMRAQQSCRCLGSLLYLASWAAADCCLAKASATEDPPPILSSRQLQSIRPWLVRLQPRRCTGTA